MLSAYILQLGQSCMYGVTFNSPVFFFKLLLEICY